MVSLEKYKCFCEKQTSGLELFTSQKGDQYIKCKAATCGFFTKASDFGEYLWAIEEKVRKEFKEKIPLCSHFTPATMHVSHSEKNPKRPFFKCSQREDDSCGYFQWGNTFPSKATKDNWKPPTQEKATQTDAKPSKGTKRYKKAVIDD